MHQNRCWSNAQAYSGEPVSWGHHLISQGHAVDSIGKLHYRGGDTDNGFENEILPMYIRDGVGDGLKGLLRDHEAFFDVSSYVREIGPGHDRYTDYDLGVTRSACQWLQNSASKSKDKPWTLFVSWLRPHYPLICPPEYLERYPLEQMDEARFTSSNELPVHPVTQTLRRHFNYDDAFDEQKPPDCPGVLLRALQLLGRPGGAGVGHARTQRARPITRLSFIQAIMGITMGIGGCGPR